MRQSVELRQPVLQQFVGARAHRTRQIADVGDERQRLVPGNVGMNVIDPRLVLLAVSEVANQREGEALRLASAFHWCGDNNRNKRRCRGKN